jgi:Xaa-Pro aminopeptidase
LERAAPGRTELELKRELEAFLWDEGASSVDFVAVQAGANAANPHHLGDETMMRSAEALLVDIAIRVDGYAADITQNVFLGVPTAEYREHFDVVSRAQEAGVQACLVGATADDVARAASQVVLDAGFGRWKGVSAGHGIGFSIHEPPRVVEGTETVLPEGAVITVEPGIYVPGSHGIRIEDTVAVTVDGPRRLTRGARPLTAKPLDDK